MRVPGLLSGAIFALALGFVTLAAASPTAPPPSAESDLLHRRLMLDGIVEWAPSSQRWRELPPPTKPAKVTVLHLWSPRCAPCVAELPLLKRMVDAWRSEPAVRFLLVADFVEDGDGSELLSFLASPTVQSWPSPVLRLRDGRLRESLGVMVQPLTLILDEQRVVRQVFVGPLGGRSVGSAVTRLLDVVR